MIAKLALLLVAVSNIYLCDIWMQQTVQKTNLSWANFMTPKKPKQKQKTCPTLDGPKLLIISFFLGTLDMVSLAKIFSLNVHIYKTA